MIRTLLRKVLGRSEAAPASLVADATPDRPIPFGYKEGWLTVLERGRGGRCQHTRSAGRRPVKLGKPF